MSDREIAKQIIDSLPEYKINKILMFLRGVQFDDEIEDNLFCEKLYQNYLADQNHETIPFEQAVKECGFSLDEIQN